MMRLGRAVLGGMVAFGLLAAVPAAVFAAQPSCGDTLTANTTLTADLDCSAYNGNALTMGHNRIVLNLNGHTIWGFVGADSDYGVYTDGYNHTVIKNGVVADFNLGVYVYRSQDTTVKNVEVYGEPADTSSTNVYVYYGVGNLLSGLNLHDAYYGVESYGTADLQMTGSTVAENYYGVYTEYDSQDLFQANTFKNNYYGIYDDYSGSNRYMSNTSKNNDSYGFYIDCDSYGKVTMSNNVAKNNGSDGFYTYDCYDNASYAPGTGGVMSGNTSTGNAGYGFYDYYMINSTWTSNTSKNNDSDGFYIEYPSGYTMTYNVANGNAGDGFYFYDNYSSGYYNAYKVSNNKANNNDSWGFDADYGVPGKGNTATGNGSGNCDNVRCN